MTEPKPALQFADFFGVISFCIAAMTMLAAPMFAGDWVCAGVLFLILGRLGRMHHWQKHIAQGGGTPVAPPPLMHNDPPEYDALAGSSSW